jgi:Ras family protein T1
MQIKVPVIVVGCKLDLRDDQQPTLEQVMAPLMHEFREIETCIECSSIKQIQIAEVFYYAQKAILHPTAPLFDQETQTLRPRCVRALKRIFILCDHDRDGALSDSELNNFQVLSCSLCSQCWLQVFFKYKNSEHMEPHST